MKDKYGKYFFNIISNFYGAEGYTSLKAKDDFQKEVYAIGKELGWDIAISDRVAVKAYSAPVRPLTDADVDRIYDFIRRNRYQLRINSTDKSLMSVVIHLGNESADVVENEANIKSLIRKVVGNAGWTENIDNDGCCVILSKGCENLYMHPEQISGVLSDDNDQAAFKKVLSILRAHGFKIGRAERCDDVLDDDDLIKFLWSRKDEIIKAVSKNIGEQIAKYKACGKKVPDIDFLRWMAADDLYEDFEKPTFKQLYGWASDNPGYITFRTISQFADAPTKKAK